MSEDEYEMTSFKRRKISEEPASDMEVEDHVEGNAIRRKGLKRKLVDLDDIDVLEENAGHGENVGIELFNLISRVIILKVSSL